jgi:hypothetical protein
LALFVRYLRGIAVGSHLERLCGSIRKSRKDLPVVELFRQLSCFFVADGTSRYLAYFDQLKKGEGYARTIETDPGTMVSSHGVKRFFKAFRWSLIYLFRRLLQQLFLWRLRMKQPPAVVLNPGTMVCE